MANEASRSTKLAISPSSQDVAKFHRNADTDSDTDAIHHTVGNGHKQAAFGDHNHEGGSGALLFDGITFTGSRAANTALIVKQIIDAMVLKGALDSTTP